MSTKKKITIKDIRENKALLDSKINEFYNLVAALRHDTREIPESLHFDSDEDEIESFLSEIYSKYEDNDLGDKDSDRRDLTKDYFKDLLETWPKMVEELYLCRKSTKEDQDPCPTVKYKGTDAPIVLTDYIESKTVCMHNYLLRKKQIHGTREYLSRLVKPGYEIAELYDWLVEKPEDYSSNIDAQDNCYNLKNVPEASIESFDIPGQVEYDYENFINALNSYLEAFDNFDDNCI